MLTLSVKRLLFNHQGARKKPQVLRHKKGRADSVVSGHYTEALSHWQDLAEKPIKGG